MSTQLVHLPQRLAIGWPVAVSGAFVNTVAQRARGPNSGVTSRQLRPIHPNPARCAAILWENAESNFLVSTVCEAGIGSAW
jgi:hypothetical protein